MSPSDSFLTWQPTAVWVCGVIVLLSGVGYVATGNEGGAGWLLLVSGLGSVIAGLLMLRERKRSGPGTVAK